MSDRLSPPSRPPHRSLVLLTTVALISTLLAVVVPPVTAAAAGTVLFDNTFYNRTVDGTGTVTKPTPTSGSNAACLTASGNSSTQPLLSCPSSTDVQGSGKLRLTSATTNLVGGVFGASSFPSSNGLDVTFNTYQYGSTQGADGMSFVLAAIDPANPTPPTTIGPSGGSLGYSPAGSVRGLPNAYLGVGLDVYGNFSSTGYQGSGCTNAANITTQVPGAVVVRGPGNGLVGYCGLTTTYEGTTSSRVTLRAGSRSSAAVPVQVLINPTTAAFTSSSGVSVSAGTYKVVVTPVGQSTKTLSGALPAASSSLYPSTTWVNANGVPKQLSFGFVGSTGSVVDFHEASNVKVVTFNQVPQLAVATTSYAVSAPAPGDPVSYVVNASVQSGAAVSKPISVTQTTPAGVLPLAAFGTGWVCATPVGQTVTCTTSGSSFAAGAALPELNVVAIVTATGMTSTTVQNSSSTTVSSADSNSGSDSATTAGTTPAAPSGVAVSPAIGPLAGGNTVTQSGSSTVGPTAIEIGTSAEFQAGTVVTLLECATGDTTSCWVVSGTNVLVYMPARSSAGTVLISTVTLGVSGSASYVYADKPAVPAAPTATAGTTSATVSWVAPATNGSPITGYVVTPYKAGVAQTALTYNSTATTQTLSGLTATSSYTFTVAAVNAYGTSSASSQSTAVVPYALPGAPTIGTATAGTSQATVTWTAPSANGSAITGYVVTPYIGTVAQTPQTFTSSATTQVVTGLTPGTAYTFAVAAKNAAGTGPLSAKSAAVTPNVSPTLTFPAPPEGRVGVAYSNQLTVNGGTSPFVWSVSVGSLPAGLTLNASTGLLSGTPTAADNDTFTVSVVDASNQSASQAVTLVITDKPGTIATPTAVPGVTSATVSWTAPTSNGSAITGYVVTPYLAGTAQTAVSFDASTTTRTLTGLTAGGSYTFTVAAVNAIGTGTASAQSAAVTPYNVPAAPTITTVTAGDGRATVTWTAPATNGSAITGYVVTPYVGTTAQTAVSFTGTGLTQTVTGLTPGTAYTFKVAAQNAGGTGAQSAASSAVTPNADPSLTFTGVPSGEVGVAYSSQLPVTGGTAPFTWSVTSGTLPAGLSLSSSGLLAGTPTSAGTSSYTVQVTDASGQSASRSVSQVIAAAPSLAFTPAAGEVNVAYSQQPTLTGGTSPIAWTLTAGSLPAGVTLSASTGLVSGTPTAAGTFSVTIRATDSFGQTASRSVSIVIAAAPTLTSSPPVARQGVGYSFTFAAVGGTGPFSYAVLTGSLPPGLSLSSGGVLSGTPTTQGTFAFTVRGTDANAQTANDAVSMVVDRPPIKLVKTASSSTAAPGTTITFTLTATNLTTDLADGVHFLDPLSDVLDDATYNGDATIAGGSGASVAYDGSTLDWRIPLQGGASATLTYSVTVKNPDTGNRVLTGTVTGYSASTSCSTGQQDSGCSAPVTVSVLSISTTASVATTTPGSAVTFSIVVSNTGQTAYSSATFSESLAGILDDASYGGNGTATAGSLSYSGSTLTWTGPLAVGASATITYTVTVANPDTGNRSLTATVLSSTAGSTCPSASPGPACSTTVTVLVPALSISSSSSVPTTTPGGSVVSTVTLTNTGQTTYTGTSVTLDLKGVLDDATRTGSTATSGELTYNPGPGTLVWTGDLALGATVTITSSVTVTDPDAGDKTLTTVVSSAAAGSTCPAGSTSSACRTTVQVLVPALTIAASADVTSTTPGSVVRFSVLLTNTGQTPYTGAAFSTSLAGVLDDATYNGDLSANVGSASYAGSTVSWTGDLAVGASATITYAVTVRAPDPGDLTLTSTVVSATRGNSCATGSSSAGCTVAVAVLLPGLSLTSAVDTGATTTPGTTVRSTFTATNTGQTSYAGVVVALDLTGTADDATSGNDATASSGTLTTQPNGTVRWVLSLAPGQTATVTASYRVNNPTTGDKVLTGSATSAAAGSSCPTATAATSCQTSVAVLIPALTLTTSASPASVTPGDVVTYTVVAANTGETAYGAVTVTDDLTGVLGDAVYTGGATASSGGTPTFASSALSWTGPLAIGATTTITFTVTVKDPDPGFKLLSDAVSSAAPGSSCPPGGNDRRCSSLVTVLVPGLTITKTADVATTTPGAAVTYTVRVTNSGTAAFTNATFSDPLGGVLDDADYNADAAVTSGGGAVGYAASTVSWSGSLAVGAAATVTYSVTVHAADGGDNRLTNTVSSPSRGNNCPTAGSDSRCTATVPVARLVLVQTATEANTTPGSLVHLSTTWTNTGQVPYVGISIVSPRADTSDDTTPGGDQTTSSGTLVRSAEAVTWTGDIGVGQVVTGARTLAVRDPDPGNRLITATLRSTAPGNNCPVGTADPRCTFAVPVLLPGLSVSKVANTTATVPGGTVSYTVTAHNTGETSYPAAALNDSLTGVLDDATYNGDAAASSGTVTYAAPTLSWTGALAVDQTVTITYTVTVKAQPGDKTMVNPVTSDDVGSNCTPASGDPACRSTVVVLTPGLTLVKTADVANATLGSTVTYTVRVTNSGQTPYASASFSDSLAGVLDDATYNGDATTTPSGTVGYASSTLSWSGPLAPGASATLTYSVTLRNPASGDRNLTNTVVSTSANSNCPAAGSDSRCTALVAVTNAVTLTLTKTADVLITAAGRVVTYTVTAVNSSALPITAANFSDPLADVVDDATYGGNAAASSGSVSLVGSTLVWGGDVPAGSTVTVTYSVTVHASATGNQILAGALVSTSPTVSNSCLAGSTDPRCTSTVPVAALVLQQAYTEPTTTPGSLLHLSATFTNTGQADYHGITVTSPSAGTLDDAIPTGDQVATSGSLVLSASALTWTGDIPVGGSVTVTGTLTVKSPDPGDKRVTGTLASSALGTNCPPDGRDPRCTALSVVQVPQLSLTMSADKTGVVPLEQVHHTLTIQDTGETAYPAATVVESLAGVLDDAEYGDDAVASAGTVAFDGSTLTWTGDLAVGQTVTVTYSVTALPPGTGDKSMITTVSSTAVGSTCAPGQTSTACISSVDVLTPLLEISTAANRSSTVPGETVTVTVTVRNVGQIVYPAGTQVVLLLGGVTDDAAYTGGATSSSGSVAFGGGDLTWTGALGLDDTVTISYAVTVDDPVTGDHLLDARTQAFVFGSNCPPDSADPRCSTSVPIASLQIADTANVSVALPNDVVRFTDTYTNTGQVPFYGLRVIIDGSDAFDDSTANADVMTSGGSLSLDLTTGLVTWTGDLPVGASVTTSASVTVDNPDRGNHRVRTRSSTTDVPSNCPPASTDPACGIDVAVLTPGLSIVQTADTTTTTPGSDVGYTLTITNSGDASYTAATVTADLSGVLDDAQGPNGAQASSGQLTPSGSTLTWTGDVGVGASVTITYSVRVRNPAPGDLNLVDQVRSEELGSSCSAADPGPSCSTLVTVLIPGLDITVAASTSTSSPGAQVGYTLTIRNSGQTSYPGASVTAALGGVLDDADYGADGEVDVGAVVFSGTDLTWTGDLAVGQTAVVTYGVTVRDPDPGDRVLRTSVASAAPGSTCTPDQPCTSSVVVRIPGLSISTTADATTATPGSRVRFTITMTNTGEQPYVGSVTTTSLSDVLDDATFDGTVTASSGATSYTAPDISWTGNLAVGAQVTISYAVTVRDPDPGDKTMSSTALNASAGSPCRAAGPSPACTATVQVLVPSLALAVSSGQATTTPGSVVDYTVLLTNDGETAYRGAVVTSELSGVLSDADYNGDGAVAGGGLLAYGSGELTWTGDLAIGASATITFSVTVHDPDTGDRQLHARVSSDVPGSSCPSGSTAAGCISTVDVLLPGLQISTTADVSAVVAGQTVHYTVTVHNTGQTAYAPATVAWSLTDLLDDGSYPADAVATSGTVQRDDDTLVWSGALPLGDTVTITYSIVTELPAPGDRSLDTAVTSDSAGSTCVEGTESGCSTRTTVLVPALTVTKRASATHVVPRGSVTYTLTATNTGEAPYPQASLTDSLRGVLDHATYSADATATVGVVAVDGDTLTWTGALEVGRSVEVSYSVVVDAVVDEPDAALVNEVFSAAAGSTCPEGTTASACTTTTVIDASTLELRGLTPSFTLSGPPESTVGLEDAVVGTVVTNSLGGYSVSVRAVDDILAGQQPGNTDSVPVGNLAVRENGTDSYEQLSTDTSVPVHNQDHATAPDGDAVSTDYQVQIPFVNADTYSGTVEYVVTAQ